MRPVKDRKDKGIIAETHALYDQLVGEARRMAERDHEAARRRGPVAKTLLAVCILAGLLAAVTLVYGFITFPDGPIRKTATGFVGKHGTSHTPADYEQYKLWEKLVVASFGSTFLTGFGAVAAEKMSNRERGK
jgi:hypothetical protein